MYSVSSVLRNTCPLFHHCKDLVLHRDVDMLIHGSEVYCSGIRVLWVCLLTLGQITAEQVAKVSVIAVLNIRANIHISVGTTWPLDMTFIHGSSEFDSLI
jgi:hypothetical protein